MKEPLLIILKTPEQIDIMDEANRILHGVLDELEKHICPGIKTIELDNIVKRETKSLGVKSAFKDYQGYPAHVCVSVNEEIVHGIPGDRVIQNGDVVSVDLGVIYKGFVSDSARTIAVGDTSKKVQSLIQSTKEALHLGIEQMQVGNVLNDISGAIGAVAKDNNYGNLSHFSGHGIGKDLHENPSVFNYVRDDIGGIHLQEGMVLALEPMFTMGSNEVKILDDGWTVVTQDRSMAAHWELSVAIQNGGPRILGRS